MVSDKIAKINIRHQILLEGLKTQEVRKFLRVFGDVDGLIIEILMKARVPDISDLSRTKLNALIQELALRQGELFSGALDAMFENLKGIGEYEKEHEVKVLKAAAKKEMRGDIATPAKDAFAEAKKRPIQSTGEVLEAMCEKWAESSIARTNDAIRLGHAQGVTVPEMVRRLMGTASLHYKDGTGAISKRAAATVVRTGVQQVANTARTLTWEENDDLVKGYMWLSTLDSKTSVQCRSLDQQHFKLGKGPLPPIHPNCRSTTTPDLGSEFDFLDEGATRSGERGYVGHDLQYFDFLKGESPAYQDRVLGEEKGKLFREGGLTSERFRELQLDKSFKPITLDQMRELEPEAFKRAGL